MASNRAERLKNLSPANRAALLKAAREKGLAAPSRLSIPVAPRPADGRMPVSFAQQRLWFLDQLEPDSAAYNVVDAPRLLGPLQVDALRKTFDEILRRHEILRTRFVVVDEEPFQIASPEATLDLPLVDLSRMPEPERESEMQRLVSEEAQRPFDLSRSPLIRVSLLKLAEDDHVLLYNVHHIASDGWSLGILSKELMVLYAAFVKGEASPFDDLALQYADFAVWQRQWLEGEVLGRQISYWKQQLAAPLPILDLPTDRPRPAVQTFRGAGLQRRFPQSLNDGLQALSRQEGTTLFMTLLAAFKVFLSRYTGQEDIVVGTPIAGRGRTELEDLIGVFTNTLVLRTDLSGELTFRQLVKRVRDRSLEAYSNQDVPFEKLVEELQPARDLSRPPLFQTMFIHQNAPGQAFGLAGFTTMGTIAKSQVAKFDLMFSVGEWVEGRTLVVEYNTDLFDETTARRMAGHFETILREAVADPDVRISRLALLTDVERRQLVEWNETARPYATDRCVHEWFEEQAARTPHAVAVRSGGASLTYRELDRQANRLARFLRGQGVGSDALVGLAIERSVDMLVGLLAVLKAGAAYVPLDVSYPAERLAVMIEDSGLAFLLTQDRLRQALPAHGARVVRVDADRALWAAESDASLGPVARPENLAYVIYTSGSTGRPKGVEVTHRSLASFLASMAEKPGLDARDVLLAVTTLSFDIAGLELFLPLTVGGQIVVASREDASDAATLIRLLETSGSTVMQATPATWRMLLDGGWEGRAGLKMLCGGEAMPGDLGRALRQRGGELWNVYGPTETTIWSTAERTVEEEVTTVSIGRPIANTQIRILDRHLEPVPVGVPGELLIGGHGLARGYRGRTDLTAEKFIPDPAGAPGSRLYRTGDLARYLADGRIEYLGRLDHQVKIRGFRIELGEIEAALSRHPQVRQAVAVAREDSPGEKRLVAYLVTSGGDVPSVGEWRRHLQDSLPEYMIPSAFVILEALPLGPSGKVDRRALPAPGADSDPKKEHIGPRNETEESLVEIWRDVLKIEVIGVHDNFFELGGHSLMATRVLSRIRSKIGVELKLPELFVRPTIATLAERVEDALLLDSGDADIDGLLDLMETVDDADAQGRVVSGVERD